MSTSALVTSEALALNSGTQLKKHSSGLAHDFSGFPSHHNGEDGAEKLNRWCREPAAEAVHIMVDQKRAEGGT